MSLNLLVTITSMFVKVYWQRQSRFKVDENCRCVREMIYLTTWMQESRIASKCFIDNIVEVAKVLIGLPIFTSSLYGQGYKRIKKLEPTPTSLDM